MHYTDDKKRLGKRRKNIIIVSVVLLLLALFFVGRAKLWGKFGGEAELLSIVSAANPLEDSFRPKLEEVRGIKLDSRCVEDLEQMLSDCEAAGFSPLLTEGYISRQEQRERYDERVKWHIGNGAAAEEAEYYAMRELFYPGTNEHELGLCVDIVDSAYRTADEKQAETLGNRWLRENCWVYGFVLRYPEGKADVTGRDFSPWHYRYVGRDAAEQMHQLQLTLEEYQMWFYSEEAIVVYS